MTHADAGTEAFREGVGLPGGWRQPGVGGLELHQVVRILEVDAAVLARVGWLEFAIEVPVGAVHAIEEFAVQAERRLWPDPLHEQAFAPARVGHHDVGPVAARGHCLHGAEGRLGAHHLGLDIDHPGVDAGGRAALRPVGHHFHPLPLGRCGARESQSGDFVARSRQGRCQVTILARKILVDE